MRALLLSALALALVGCDGTDAPVDPIPVEKTEVHCEVGVPVHGGEGFESAAVGANGELVLGFQGLLFVELVIRAAPGELPALSSVDYSIALELGSTTGGTQAKVPLAQDSAAGAYTAPFIVFLNGGDMSTYVGQRAVLAIRLEGPDQFCVAKGVLNLVDDDLCVHTGSEIECPDEGQP